MDKKTYEALKRLIKLHSEILYTKAISKGQLKDLLAIEGWISEVAKEYEGD